MLNSLNLDPLIHILRLKSISTQDEYLPEMENTRHFLTDLFQSMQFEVKILKGKKHDLVFAQRIFNKSLPTVLIYGHYDVQPADPISEWITDPFEPVIKNNKLYSRGATDNKGQLMLQIMAVKNYLKSLGSSSSTCNFKFIIEGEEEIGSLSVESIAKKYSSNLLNCDFLIVSDGEMLYGTDPSIEISLRGLLYTEVAIETSKQDLHSGIFGGVAYNPAIILSQIIANLKDAQGKILIPHFYDNVIPPTKEELKDYNLLKPQPKEIIDEGQLYALSNDESDKFSINERRWSRPTLDVNGFISGYTGEGAKTIIPSKATAKISMRLVHNQDVEKIYHNFSKYLQTLVPKSVKLTITKHSTSLPYKAPTNHPIFTLAKHSLKQTFKKEVKFVGVGGSIGFIPVVTQALNVPAVLIGFGSTGVMHTPNEYISLDNYFRGIDAMVNFFSSIPPKK